MEPMRAMDKDADERQGLAVTAAREHARLQQQIADARTVLSRLQNDVAYAQSHLGSIVAAQLVEVNEALVLSALRAQSDAESAAQALGEATRSSEFDVLTRLPNRVLLRDRFTQASAGAKRHRSRMAVLFIDLNGFKQINDAFGHGVGDLVLQLASQRLGSAVREADTVSRYGGDEFVILLTELTQASDALRTADKIIAALGAPGSVEGLPMQLTASIGISIYPDDGQDLETLVERADAAMYRAKRQHLGRIAFWGMTPALEQVLQAPAPGPQRAGGLMRERAPDERGPEHAQLENAREANAQLLLAALHAQEMRAAAELAQQRLTRLIDIVAHELRNPLAPIRTAAALLVRVQSQELPRLQVIIERQVLRVLSLIGDLLDVSRIRTGKLRLERQPAVDMAGIVAEAVDACSSATKERQQRLEVAVAAGPLQVNGDPARLVQIVSNLLDNASKYTPRGGAIRLSAADVDDELALTVADNGVGITAATLPHIFEPFVQDPHAAGLSGTGLGIGLSVVQELVQAHGGRVVARSAGAGQGSEFVVTLPLVGRVPHAERGAAAQPVQRPPVYTSPGALVRPATSE